MTSPEIEELKLLVENKYSKVPTTSTDFEELSISIKRTINADISASTMKRLWGYVGDSHKARTSTLDVLARYIGHTNFSKFVNWLKSSTRYNSSFFNANQLISSELTEGDTVHIGWSPNRLIKLLYLGASRYKILTAENSKLRKGDIFVTGCFITGQPLYLPFIERNGTRTSPFVAGRNGGLTIIKVNND